MSLIHHERGHCGVCGHTFARHDSEQGCDHETCECKRVWRYVNGSDLYGEMREAE